VTAVPKGIDVFRIYQNVQDWRAVRNSGVEYCWAKATNGTRVAFNNDAARTPAPADPTVAGARSVGIAPGLYSYALPGDPIAQADVLANEVIRLGCRGPGTLPPALDLEEPGTESVDFAVKFLRRLQERIGQQRVCVYMSASWAQRLRPDTWNVPGLVIWIAAYGSNNGGRHAVPYYSGRTDVHQFTSLGLHLVPGIQSSGLDVNESNIPLGTLLGGDEEDDVSAEDVWNFPIDRTPDEHDARTKVPAGDLLRFGNEKAGRAELYAAAALDAVRGLLDVELPHPTETVTEMVGSHEVTRPRMYRLSEYLVWGNVAAWEAATNTRDEQAAETATSDKEASA
jgi:GH25 family lysozyme M1 (1,4-beta-N-acetylmuramidase)